MILKGEFSDERYVALLAEGVDRNSLRTGKGEVGKVALLAEGVDRNIVKYWAQWLFGVALLAEGVDRNNTIIKITKILLSRPPRGGRG